MSPSTVKQQAECNRAKVYLDGTLLDQRAHQILVKEIPLAEREPEARCSQTITHILIGNYTDCTLAMGHIRDLFHGAVEKPDCGVRGRKVDLIQCDENGVNHRGVIEAAACHANSQRDPEQTLIVKEILLTTEADESKWTQLFRDSFDCHCR